MKHRVFKITSAFSVLLLIATATICVRSYFKTEVLIWTEPHSFFGIESGRGGILFVRIREVGEEASDGNWEHGFHYQKDRVAYPTDQNWDVVRSHWATLGFLWTHGRMIGAGWKYASVVDGYSMIIPYYAPLALLAVLSILLGGHSWRARIAAMRTRRGACHRCGYDLRATPDRCPECGTVRAS